MTRFQELLKPDLDATPGEDQRRASLLLPDIVGESHLLCWTIGSAMPASGTLILVLVATYSHYDLAMLDILDEEVSRRPPGDLSRSVTVHVADLQRYETAGQLAKDIPVIDGAILQTPVTAVWEDGAWRRSASGKPARDLVASTLGLSPDEFNQMVMARVPTYRPPA